jgi:hypothetical protein
VRQTPTTNITFRQKVYLSPQAIAKEIDNLPLEERYKAQTEMLKAIRALGDIYDHGLAFYFDYDPNRAISQLREQVRENPARYSRRCADIST